MYPYALHMDTLHSGCVCVLCSMRLLPVVSCVETQKGEKVWEVSCKKKYTSLRSCFYVGKNCCKYLKNMLGCSIIEESSE